MSSLQTFRQFFDERLSAAAEEIFRVFEKTVLEYEGEISRQRKLLDSVGKLQTQFNLLELPEPNVREEDVVIVQLPSKLEKSSSVDQKKSEAPQIKEEQEELCIELDSEELLLHQEMESVHATSTYVRSDHNEDQILDWNPDESQGATQQPSLDAPVSNEHIEEPEINTDNQSFYNISNPADSYHNIRGMAYNGGTESEAFSTWTSPTPFKRRSNGKKSFCCNICDRRFTHSSSLSRHRRIHRDFKRHKISEEERIVRPQRRSRKSLRVVQEEWDDTQIKEEQEELCIELDSEPPLLHQKTQTLDGTCTDVKSDHIEGQIPDWNLDESQCAALQTSLDTSSLERSEVAETNTDQLLYNISDLADGFDNTKGMQYSEDTQSEASRPQMSQTSLDCRSNGKKSFYCNICSRRFTHLSSLSRHRRLHKSENPYCCNICRKRFNQPSALRIHKRIHAEFQMHHIYTEEKQVLDEQQLWKQEKSSNVEQEDSNSFGVTSHGTTSGLQHNRDPESSRANGKKCHFCNLCSEQFTHPASLKEHVRIHTGEKPFSCNPCGRTFAFKSNWYRHMKNHTQKPHSCKTCGIAFSQMSHLKEHLRVHASEILQACKSCGKFFKNATELALHMRSHVADRPFLCFTCGRRFTQLRHLKIHKNTHRRETTFV